MDITTLVLSAVAGSVVTALSLVFIPGRKTRRHRRHLKQKLDRLQRRHSELAGAANLIREHSGTYFNGLHEAGLGRLIQISDELGRALVECQTLLKKKRLEQLSMVLSYLREHDPDYSPSMDQSVSADLKLLNNWEAKCVELTMACIAVLRESNTATDILGIDRRRLTIHTLVDLRRALTQ